MSDPRTEAKSYPEYRICRALLADSVSCQLRSDVPVGIFLSGGVDSSLIAHYAKTVAEKSYLHFRAEKSTRPQPPDCRRVRVRHMWSRFNQTISTVFRTLSRLSINRWATPSFYPPGNSAAQRRGTCKLSYRAKALMKFSAVMRICRSSARFRAWLRLRRLCVGFRLSSSGSNYGSDTAVRQIRSDRARQGSGGGAYGSHRRPKTAVGSERHHE